MRDKKLVDLLLPYENSVNWIDLTDKTDYLLIFSGNFNTDLFRWLSFRRRFHGAHIQYSISVLFLMAFPLYWKGADNWIYCHHDMDETTNVMGLIASAQLLEKTWWVWWMSNAHSRQVIQFYLMSRIALPFDNRDFQCCNKRGGASTSLWGI